jgi:solute carrier family 25 protein 33/36
MIYLIGIQQIYQREGIRGFYKGLTASFLGIVESAVYFVIYEKTKKLSSDRKALEMGLSPIDYEKRNILRIWLLNDEIEGHALSPITYLALGGSCKLLASAITYPHEVVRTRMREIVNGQCRYPHLIGAFKTIAAEEGIRGLYAGMGAHLIRVVPNTAIMFAVYEAVVHFGGKMFVPAVMLTTNSY